MNRIDLYEDNAGGLYVVYQDTVYTGLEHSNDTFATIVASCSVVSMAT